MSRDVDPRAPLADEGGSNLGFGLAHILGKAVVSEHVSGERWGGRGARVGGGNRTLTLISLPHLLPKQELPVQVRDVDRIQVDDLNGTEPRHREVLQEFAPEAPRADHEDLRGEEGRCGRGRVVLAHREGATLRAVRAGAEQNVLQRGTEGGSGDGEGGRRKRRRGERRG